MDLQGLWLLDRGISRLFYSTALPTSLVDQHQLARHMMDFAMDFPDVAKKWGPESVVLTVEAALARLKDIVHLHERPVDALLEANRVWLGCHREYALQAETDPEQIIFWLVLNCVEGHPSPLLPDPLAYRPLLGADGHRRFLAELSASYPEGNGPEHQELLPAASTRLRFMQLRLADPMALEDSVRQIIADAQQDHAPLLAYIIITLLQFGKAELAGVLHHQAVEASGQSTPVSADRAWQTLREHAASASAQAPTPDLFHLQFMTTFLFQRWPSAVAARRLRTLSGALWPIYFQTHVETILAEHPAEMMRYRLRDKNYQQAWDWAYQNAWDPTGSEVEVWLELLTQIATDRPEEVLHTIEHKVDALIGLEQARSYELACQYLQLSRRLASELGALPSFERWVAQLRRNYAKRTRFIAALDLAGL